MKRQILSIFFIIIMISSSFVANANLIQSEKIKSNNDESSVEIRVALLTERPIGWGLEYFLFIQILQDFEWTAGNKTYFFNVTKILDKDIYNGNLTTANFDLLLVPGGAVGDGEAIVKGFPNMPKVKEWKENIEKFVKNGGGYAGFCGGAALATELTKFPTTFLERQYHKSALGITCVKSYYKEIATPLFNVAQLWHPEKVGAAIYGFCEGVPLEIQMFKDNPLFSDYPKQTEHVQWVGGPALVIPENPDREIAVLARYPVQEISENESTQVYAWRYTGGLLSILRGFMDRILSIVKGEVPPEYRKNIFNSLFFDATDWEHTDKLIELDYSNKPCMTAEIYPNENNARIFLSGPHPEYSTWWGGELVAAEDTDENCMSDYLYSWVNITPYKDTPGDERTHSWWIVRRAIAWASKKVPEDELMPIYGDLKANVDFDESQLLGQMPYIIKPAPTGGYPPYKYEWELGNGTISNENIIVVSHDSAGIYNGTLTITDRYNNTDSHFFRYVVNDDSTSFKVTLDSNKKKTHAGDNITFTADVNCSGNYTYNFTFGDESYCKTLAISQSNYSINHSYSDKQMYYAIVTVKNEYSESYRSITKILIDNWGPPSKPTLTGPTSGKPGTKYDTNNELIFNITATDPDGEQIWFKIDMGDGRNHDDLLRKFPFESGELVRWDYNWPEEGEYQVRIKALDTQEYESEWSDSLFVTIKK